MAIIYRGRQLGNYVYWTDNDPTPIPTPTDISVINTPVLTASFVDKSVFAPQGISGSLTRLTDGSSYLIAGTNITLTTGANGSVTIDSSGGGGGTSFFYSNNPNIIEQSGSLFQ